MNCGYCLFKDAVKVELVADKCPTCKTDYSRSATQAEIVKQAGGVKPVVHTAGVGKFILPTRIFHMRPMSAVSVAPILGIEEVAQVKSTTKLVVSTTVKTVVEGDDEKTEVVDGAAAKKVVEWLTTHGHVSEGTALNAMKATPIFGKGVANAMAKQGLLSCSGNKRGCKYWVSP